MSSSGFGETSVDTTGRARSFVLAAHASFIGMAGLAGMIFDFGGAFLGIGPQGQVLEAAPHAAIGFGEAHGLAVILAVMLVRGPATRSLNWFGFAAALLLGTSNLIFREVFVAGDAVVMGYLTTALHGLFAVLHFALATRSRRTVYS